MFKRASNRGPGFAVSQRESLPEIPLDGQPQPPVATPEAYPSGYGEAEEACRDCGRRTYQGYPLCHSCQGKPTPQQRLKR
jgi:hypothetical protein